MLSKLWKITLIVIIAAAAAVGTLAFVPRNQQGVIPEGIQVAGMDWGGKSPAAARAEMEKWRKSQLKRVVTIKLPPDLKSRRKWTAKRTDLGTDIDVNATLQAASQLEGEGPLDRLASWFTAPKRVQLDPVWKIDHERIRKYLKTNIAPRVFQPPTDARLAAVGQELVKKEEKPGVELDLDSSAAAIAERIPESDAEAAIISLKPAAPRVTLADLEGIDQEIARYRTSHSSGGNRASNIRIACAKMNGVVIRPGDIFSYNKVIGRRERADGYRIAPVISDGQLVPGMAGGVCQTSSTLYNAALLADLKIVKRSHHTFPVRYLPAGRDATVAWGSIDFQFQNNTDGPIAVLADGSGGQVLVRIYGRKAPGKSVSVASTRSGLRATVWRIVKQDSKLVRRELVSRDVYRPAPPAQPARRRIAGRRTEPRAANRAVRSASGNRPRSQPTALPAPVATTESPSEPTPAEP